MASDDHSDGGRESAALMDNRLIYLHANEIRWVNADGDASGTTLVSFPEDPRSMAIVDGAVYVIVDGGLQRLVLPADF